MGSWVGPPVSLPLEEDGLGSGAASAEVHVSASDVVVRRARLADAELIAAFVNAARSEDPRGSYAQLSRRDVALRFGQVGFMIAESQGRVVGLLGWQVENLVVRVSDFLITYGRDPAEIGRVLVSRMEEDAAELLVEAVILFLPSRPSEALVAFWESLDYEFQNLDDLPPAWQEAVAEYDLVGRGVMMKRLRDDLIRRPI